MKNITLEELLEAGCYFGHQVNRRNPKADEFIFEARSGIHIINLEKTREGLINAAEFLKHLSSSGGYLVVIGTKRQAKGVVKEEVERARAEGAKGIFYVTSRWVGGTLTNFEEVAKNFKRLKELRDFLTSEKKESYTKREIVLFEREKNKLEGLYEGILDLDRIPDALYIIDVHQESTAVKETIIKGIKTTGIVDTNADPSVVNYPIPANDDAVGSIKIITNYLIDAWIEGSESRKGRDRLQGKAADKGGQKEVKSEKLKVKNEDKKEEKKEEEKEGVKGEKAETKPAKKSVSKDKKTKEKGAEKAKK